MQTFHEDQPHGQTIPSFHIVVLPGDYGGPEVMQQGLKVLDEVCRQNEGLVKIRTTEHLIGGAAYDKTGQPISPETIEACKASSAVLLGAVGGPAWNGNPVPVESGLAQLRKAMDAFGNIRPINFAAPSLVEASALKPHLVKDADILIVRELTGGIYYGERHEHNGSFDRASDLEQYDRETITRAARLAASLAASREPPLPVTSLDKANLLAACGRLWRGVVGQVMAKEFPNLELRHMLIDSAAMTMACNPTKLNGVVLTSNMFGDIISDEASAIPGSLGLLPSASLCDVPDNIHESTVRGIYEPVHGSAPDIAGLDVINPVGMILSVAMMLRYSLGMSQPAKAVELAVRDVMESGCKTKDLGGTASTTTFGDAVVERLRMNLPVR